ncbi:ALR-like protein [Mya arenaria]|uniref:ALR-like protein n=1 Tax=Mya arenaria TaxID=6604 RepID=A0ABY7DKL3_MYAAR|nr:ALR-like protein [Mya arenaria]
MDTLPDFNYEDAFKLVERPTFVKVDLDRMLQNVNVVRENISTGTEIIAVVKGNAYGHGLLHVARFLEQYAKVTCFSVATVTEGKELCESGIKSDIIVLGNITGYEISTLIQHRLITCISDIATLEIWNQQRENNVVANGALDSNDVSTRLANLPAPSESLPVIIQVDTGMAVSGCHVDQLAGIMEGHWHSRARSELVRCVPRRGNGSGLRACRRGRVWTSDRCQENDKRVAVLQLGYGDGFSRSMTGGSGPNAK